MHILHKKLNKFIPNYSYLGHNYLQAASEKDKMGRKGSELPLTVSISEFINGNCYYNTDVK